MASVATGASSPKPVQQAASNLELSFRGVLEAHNGLQVYGYDGLDISSLEPSSGGRRGHGSSTTSADPSAGASSFATVVASSSVDQPCFMDMAQILLQVATPEMVQVR